MHLMSRVISNTPQVFLTLRQKRDRSIGKLSPVVANYRLWADEVNVNTCVAQRGPPIKPLAIGPLPNACLASRLDGNGNELPILRVNIRRQRQSIEFGKAAVHSRRDRNALDTGAVTLIVQQPLEENISWALALSRLCLAQVLLDNLVSIVNHDTPLFDQLRQLVNTLLAAQITCSVRILATSGASPPIWRAST